MEQDKQKEEVNNDKTIGVMHLYLYEKIKQRMAENPESLEEKVVIKRGFIDKVFWGYQIPHEYRAKFLREMEQYGLIKIMKGRKIKLLR